MLLRAASSLAGRCLLTATVLCCVANAQLLAQGHNWAKEYADADKEYKNNGDMRRAFEEMLKGERQPGKDDDKTIDLHARRLVYELALPNLDMPGKVTQLVVLGFDGLVRSMGLHKETNQAFRQLFARQVAAHVRELENDTTLRLINKMNAVRLLERLARDGQQDVADVCVEVLDNAQQNDATRYWAVKALHELFKQGDFKDKKRQAACTVALIAQLKRHYPAADDFPQDLLDGVRLYRREVIRALAEARHPSLESGDEKIPPARTALELLRVTRGEGLSPKPRIDEQIEAAIGVARMQAQLTKGYQPDYAAQHLGNFVVAFAELARNKEALPKLTSDATGGRTEALLRYYSAPLADAMLKMAQDPGLKDMAKDNATKAVPAYVEKVVGMCVEILTDLHGAGGNPGKLQGWLADNPAPNQTLYKGVADSTLGASPAPTELKTPEPPAKPSDK